MDPEAVALHDKFLEVNKRYDAAFKQMATKVNRQPIEIIIMMTMAEKDNLVSQKELSLLLYESKQTINSAVKRLQSQGFIKLVTHPDDGRFKLLALTQSGCQFVIQHRTTINQVTNQVFDHYTPIQVQQFVSMLDDYVDTLEKHIDNISR